jgi:hypothetical protein
MLGIFHVYGMNKGLPSSLGMCAFMCVYRCVFYCYYLINRCVPQIRRPRAHRPTSKISSAVVRIQARPVNTLLSFSLVLTKGLSGSVVSASKRNLEQYLAAVAEEKRREAFKPQDPHDRGRCFTAEVRVPSSSCTTYTHTHASHCFCALSVCVCRPW